MTRSRSVSPTQGSGYPARTTFEGRESRSVSPTTHVHRTSFEARNSSRNASGSRAGRNRSNSRGTPVTNSPRGRPLAHTGHSNHATPPSLYTHSGPYIRRTNSDNALNHNFQSAPDLNGWSSALATISAAARLKPVLPPSFGDPGLPTVEADREAAIQNYYKDCGLEFEPLDKQEVHELADEKLTGSEIKNMVVDFGRESSWVAHNIETEKTQALLSSWEESKRPKEIGTRWIAIFDAHSQAELLDQILLKYGLSTRLRATMLSPPGRGNLEIAQKVWHWSTVEYSPQFLAVGFNMLHNTVSRKNLRRAREDFQDTTILQEAAAINPGVARDENLGWLKGLMKQKESPTNSTVLPFSNGSSLEEGGKPGVKPGNQQGIFSVLMKRMSTMGKQQPQDDDDFETFREALRRQFSSKTKGKGKKPVRRHGADIDRDSLDDEMSMNQDYSDEEDEEDDIFACNEAEENYNDLHYNPHMLRLWIWLIMTHDGTVISIHEPIPQMRKDITDPKDIRDTTAHIRRNIRVVLRCLSKAGLAKKRSGSNDVEVAMEQGAMVVRRAFGQARDLLFYYLFDDWYASWSLAVDRAHPYTRELNEIRGEDPMLDHIDKLHDIARRLASLKRVYQSYGEILDRLIENKAYFKDPQNKCFSVLSMNRFERLKYRISQLAISEIEDCEQEANGLISLTYNRLNFRETKAVERLSMLSVALAKITIIFLPISIITGYFGMEGVSGISGLYDRENFWTAIGVAMAITFIFLWIMGGFTGTTWERIKSLPMVKSLMKGKKNVKRRVGYFNYKFARKLA